MRLQASVAAVPSLCRPLTRGLCALPSRRYPDVPTSTRDELLFAVARRLSAQRKQSFRRYVTDLNNWESGISIGHALEVADVRNLLDKASAGVQVGAAALYGGGPLCSVPASAAHARVLLHNRSQHDT